MPAISFIGCRRSRGRGGARASLFTRQHFPGTAESSAATWTAGRTRARRQADLALQESYRQGPANAIPINSPRQTHPRPDDRQLKVWQIKQSALPTRAPCSLPANSVCGSNIVGISRPPPSSFWRRPLSLRCSSSNASPAPICRSEFAFQTSEMIHLNSERNHRRADRFSCARAQSAAGGNSQLRRGRRDLSQGCYPPRTSQRVQEFLRQYPPYDDHRAANIINHMRQLLKKRDTADWQEFDFNDVVREALEILRPRRSSEA